MRNFIFLIFIICFQNCAKQEVKITENEEYPPVLVDILEPRTGIIDTLQVPKYIRSEVATISKLNYFSDGISGKGDVEEDKIPPYSTFIELKNKASRTDLQKLTSNKNDVIAFYAHLAISENSPNVIPKVFSNFLEKNNKIFSRRGCLVGEVETSELFYDEFSKFNLSPELSAEISKIALQHRNTTKYVFTLEKRKKSN
ncbi:hypothetical protein [Soonwooa sp.]|uniref:hypothetical protein n=2 Tax=Soonwooa sp. TaxID=1938592 RepID=UPI0028A99D8B|nr:hypothetical protein [Soonwooa sp.]